MGAVSPLTLSLVVWAVITGLFGVLAIYRSLISMKEDDQLFLSAGESKIEAEQKEIIIKLNRITPWTKGLGFASLGLLFLSGGIWIYQQFAAGRTLP